MPFYRNAPHELVSGDDAENVNLRLFSPKPILQKDAYNVIMAFSLR